MQDGVAQDLDLPGLSVAGVELNGTVIGVEVEVTRRSGVGAQIRLDAGEERGVGARRLVPTSIESDCGTPRDSAAASNMARSR